MREQVVDQSEVSAQRTFGHLLRDYRLREGITMRALAAILEVDESTIARVEAGTRRPPRRVSFYERLRQVPGITDSEIQALMRTDGAPRWLVPDEPSQPQANYRSRTLAAGGYHVDFQIRPEPSEERIDENELEAISEIVKQEIKACLRDYAERKASRALRLVRD